jgi:hypothetical protein
MNYTSLNSSLLDVLKYQYTDDTQYYAYPSYINHNYAISHQLIIGEKQMSALTACYPLNFEIKEVKNGFILSAKNSSTDVYVFNTLAAAFKFLEKEHARRNSTD